MIVIKLKIDKNPQQQQQEMTKLTIHLKDNVPKTSRQEVRLQTKP